MRESQYAHTAGFAFKGRLSDRSAPSATRAGWASNEVLRQGVLAALA